MAGMAGWWLWLHAGILAGIFSELLVLIWLLWRADVRSRYSGTRGAREARRYPNGCSARP